MPVPQPARTAAVVIAAALLLAGCGRGDDGTSEDAEGFGSAPAATSAPTAEPATPTGAADVPGADGEQPGGTAQPGAGGHPAGSGNGTTGGTAKGGAPTPAGPKIVSFRVAQRPTCPAGTTVNPIAGTPVVLEWKVTNVDQVALSVDGPGIYADNYPPTGTETLNFPCSGDEGDVQKHTYRLTVTNAAGKAEKTLVVTATVHEIAEV